MGLFTGIKAMKAAKKIRKGGKAKFSYAMISMLIINLQDAKACLPFDKYKAVEDLFMEFQKCTTLFEVDTNGYIALCEDVIKKFDAIAPYEKYSGGNELEYSMLMDEIRQDEIKKKEIILESMIDSCEIDEEYIQYLLSNNPMATHENAVDFYKVLLTFKLSGKDAALKRFDTFVNNLAKQDPLDAILVIPYFCGALYPNGILSQEESNDLSKRYVEELSDVIYGKR